VDGVVDMKRLKKQIECYRLYRSMGIRTIDQVSPCSSISSSRLLFLLTSLCPDSLPLPLQARKYETERKRREYQLKAQKSRQSYAGESSTSALSHTISTPINNGVTEPQQTTNVTTRRAQSLSSSAATATASPIPFLQMNDNGNNDSALLVEIPRSFKNAPGAQLLSSLELELCFKTQLFPLQYIAILEAVVRSVISTLLSFIVPSSVRECYRNGSLTLAGFHRVVRVIAPRSCFSFPLLCFPHQTLLVS
jgi:hypothetical protein